MPHRTSKFRIGSVLAVIFAGLFAVCGLNVCAQDGVAGTEATLFVGDITQSASIPFSFVYGVQQSSVLLAGIKPAVKTIEENDRIRQIEKVWQCEDGLEVTLNAKYYKDFGATEWITYISYKGKKNSKIISNLYGLDNLFAVNAGNNVVIHANKGDNCTKFSYEPYDIELSKGQKEEFSPTPGGKSSTGERGWPYWNVQNGKQGWIVAVGWPGTWQNTYSRENDTTFRVRAGQKNFHSYLKPGETVRTPLICVLPWEAENVTIAQNIWRKFYLEHVIPHFNGEPEKPATEIQCALNEASVARIQAYINAGIKPKICWNDAGWYPTLTGDWLETGDWVPDPNSFPKGIRLYTDLAHQRSVECLLWFEPERVYKGNNDLYNHHKDWLVPSCDDCCATLNLGNDECQRWLINYIDSLIVTYGLDWYREDLNGTGPRCLWDALDSRDRKGVTENFYVQGHLAYWDALKKRHPNLHIDACASGGRRNDLETMHRAVPLLRSDYQSKNMGDDYIIGNQAHTWALSAWFPFQGSAVYEYEPYKYRSFYLPCFGMGYMKDDNKAAIIRAYKECVQIQPMMLYGDYWPLTPYSLDSKDWMAWQFNRENEGDGCVQVFRRENCSGRKITTKLHGLEAKANYQVKNMDSQKASTYTGNRLMERGLTITVDEQPGAAVLVFMKVK